MNTKELTKTEYPSRHIYDPKTYILKLVMKDEAEIETVVDLQGTAGQPKYVPCEVIFTN